MGIAGRGPGPGPRASADAAARGPPRPRATEFTWRLGLPPPGPAAVERRDFTRREPGRWSGPHVAATAALAVRPLAASGLPHRSSCGHRGRRCRCHPAAPTVILKRTQPIGSARRSEIGVALVDGQQLFIRQGTGLVVVAWSRVVPARTPGSSSSASPPSSPPGLATTARRRTARPAPRPTGGSRPLVPRSPDTISDGCH